MKVIFQNLLRHIDNHMHLYYLFQQALSPYTHLDIFDLDNLYHDQDLS